MYAVISEFQGVRQTTRHPERREAEDAMDAAMSQGADWCVLKPYPSPPPWMDYAALSLVGLGVAFAAGWVSYWW
jgi:hypothetical protein